MQKHRLFPLRKSATLIASLSLMYSCTPTTTLHNPAVNIQPSPLQAQMPPSSNVRANKGFQVKNTGASSLTSSTQANLFHKEFLAQNFYRGKGKPQNQTTVFSLTEEELTRKFVMTIENGPDQVGKVSSAVVRLNGTEILAPKHFDGNGVKYPAFVEGVNLNTIRQKISFAPQHLKAGENRLEVELRSAPGSALKISLHGFLDPSEAPGAVHSKISHDASQLDLPYVKGVLRVKFTEGLRVRIDEDKQEVYDQTGIELSLFNEWLKSAGVRSIHRTFGDETYEKNDEIEATIEARTGNDAANGNLFYSLLIDEHQDVWPLIEQMRAMPFVEEAYPIFIPESTTPQYPLSSAYSGTDNWKTMLNLQGLDNQINFAQRNQNNRPVVALLDGRVAWHENLAFTTTGTDRGTEDPASYLFNTQNPVNESTGHATRIAGLLWGLPETDKNYSGGLAYGASKPLFINAYTSGQPSACRGTGTPGCDATADSIKLASNRGAKVIVLQGWSANGKTIEENWPDVRAAVQAAVDNQVTVIVPAGNIPCASHPENSQARTKCMDNQDILTTGATGTVRFHDVSTTINDTGSILVGGVSTSGNQVTNVPEQAQLSGASDGKVYFVHYNSGASLRSFGGRHGIDVSAPSSNVYSTTINNIQGNRSYQIGTSDGGTSSGVAAVGGIVALMKAVAPNLGPTDIRNILRETRGQDNQNYKTAGVVDAAAAICQANGQYCGSGFGIQSISSEPPANAPAEAQVWITRDSQRLPVTSNQMIGIGIEAPYMDQIRIEIDGKEMPLHEVAQNYVLFEVLSNLEPGVKDLVVRYGDQQITLTQALEYQYGGGCLSDTWSIRAYNVDDTARAYINLNNVLTVNFKEDSGYVPITSNLLPGTNLLRFTLYNGTWGYTWGFQIKKNDEIVYENQAGIEGVIGANGHDQTRQQQVVFDETVALTRNSDNCITLGGQGLRGKVYNNVNFSSPIYMTKIFSLLDYIEKDKLDDQFGVGLKENFSIHFEGKLTLPEGYNAGTYTLILGHDDGGSMSFDGVKVIDALGGQDYTEHSTQVQLTPGTSYPIQIEYQEFVKEAELGLFWIKPDGTKEFVPATALSH